MSKYGVYSGPSFPVFSPDTEKYGPEITPYLDTCRAVLNVRLHVSSIQITKHLQIVNIYKIFTKCEYLHIKMSRFKHATKLLKRAAACLKHKLTLECPNLPWFIFEEL